MATVLSANFIPGEEGTGAVYIENMANVNQLIHLATSVFGLGSQWISVPHTWADSLRDILDVPAALDIFTVVPIGYPLYKPHPVYRRDLDALIHNGKYDRSRYRKNEDIIQFIRDLRSKTVPAYHQAPGS